MLSPRARTLPVVAAALMTALATPLWLSAAQGATLQRGLGPEPDSLHIHQAQGLAAVNLLRDIREGLVTFDAAGEPVPGQAADWEVLDGGRRYRFTLREGLRWSNGDPLTADDFVRAWRQAFSPDSTAATAGLLKDLRNAQAILQGKADAAELGVRADGPGVVEIELEQPAPWILEILAHPVAFPLHESGLDDVQGAPVNGAFLLQEWAPRARIDLQRNPFYHAVAEVALESVAYLPIEEPATELAMYRSGELQVTETIPAGRYEWLRENLPEDLRVWPYLGSFWLGLNLRHPVLGASVELRRALALAINREILVGTVLGAGELPGWSIVPPGMPGYEPAVMPESAWTQAEREAEARRLFAIWQAGRDEFLRLELRYNTSGVHRRIAVAVAAMWKQVLGIATELVNEEWKVFVNNRKMGVVTEVFRGGWIADYADPASFLDLFIADSSLNSTFYANGPYDRLIAAAAGATGASRLDLLHQAETRLIEDVPAIPLYYYVSRHLVNPAVTGFENNVRDIHLSRYLQLERKQP